MKSPFNSPRALFALLTALCPVCIVIGVLLGIQMGIAPVHLRAELEGLTVTDVLILLSMAANIVLWAAAWFSFMGLCRRMMQGGTAFTKENRRTLCIIGGCVAAIGVLVFLRCVPRLWTAPLLYSLLEAVAVPCGFWTVALLAFILRRLLKKAMALEEDQRGVI